MSQSVQEHEVTTKTNILDIEVPKELEKNARTGWEFIDHLFAKDGITPSTVALVTGTPGTGKTTMALQIANSVTSMGHIAYFNTCEESLYQIRKTVRRLVLKSGFIPGTEGNIQSILMRARKIQKENPGKQVFLFVDSLQTVENFEFPSATIKRPRGRPAGVGPGAREIKVMSAIREWAKKTYGIALVVGQVTKKGQFAGRMAVKHDCDCHLNLEFANFRTAKELGVEPGSRLAMMEKNRFGEAGTRYGFSIMEKGIQFEDLPDKDDEW